MCDTLIGAPPLRVCYVRSFRLEMVDCGRVLEPDVAHWRRVWCSTAVPRSDVRAPPSAGQYMHLHGAAEVADGSWVYPWLLCGADYGVRTHASQPPLCS